MEHKFTAAGSYSLAASLLRKINDEAFRLNKFPAFAVTFENMPFDTPKDWVMVPLSEFQRLL
jgi:hypothetical protein